MKTKIYQTIKGLIILFIKLQSSIKCNQTFKLLRISTFNIYLNFSLNPNDLITWIISNIFVSSPICLMILDVYLQKFLCIQSESNPGLRTCQAWEPLVYPPGGLYHFRQCPDIVMGNKADIHTRKKS